MSIQHESQRGYVYVMCVLQHLEMLKHCVVQTVSHKVHTWTGTFLDGTLLKDNK